VITGHAQFASSLLKRTIKRDPNSKSMRVRLANSYFMLGRKDTALKIYDKIRMRNVSAMLYKKLFALLDAGRIEEAKSLEQRVVPQWPSLVEGFKGNEVPGIKETDYNLKLERGLAHFAAGNNEQANRIAREVDSSQLGPQQLMELTHIMGGIIPFAKSAIPNFYERLNEAGVKVEPYILVNRDVHRVVQEAAVGYASEGAGTE